MKIFLKELLKAIVFMLLGVIIFLKGVFEPAPDAEPRQTFKNNTYWISDIKGAQGYKITHSQHPFYDITIYLNVPENPQFQGRMKYIGERKETVSVFEAKYYDGTRLYLLPGGYLEKVSSKTKQ